MDVTTQQMLTAIDLAMTDPAYADLRGALDAALAAVQEIDDDDRPVRLSPDDRGRALEALFFGTGLETTKEMLAVYSHLAGLSIGADEGPLVEIFDPEELLDVNTRQPALRTGRPGVMFFASDGGDGFYAVDVAGATSGRAGAVLWADRGSSRHELLAPDLPDFLRAAASGELATE